MIKIGCTAFKEKSNAINAKNNLIQKFNFIDLDKKPNTDVDIIIMLGGDGFALSVINKFIDRDVKFYGLNYGSIGFLMNNIKINNLDNFLNKIETSEEFCIKPLLINAINTDGKQFSRRSINDVSIIRSDSSALKLKLSINKITKIEHMISDGLLVSTPIGSTAYNFSVGGSILPIDSELISIMPISLFRPRFWRGAILENSIHISVDIIDPKKRPAMLTSDFNSIKNIHKFDVTVCKNSKIKILFDSEQSIKQRRISEQFMCID